MKLRVDFVDLLMLAYAVLSTFVIGVIIYEGRYEHWLALVSFLIHGIMAFVILRKIFRKGVH